MDVKYYKIEEVAKRTGLTKRALRYYEDFELVQPVRTDSSYRLYTDEDIEKILRIKMLKDSLGFSLIQLKDILDLEAGLKKLLGGGTSKPDETDKYKKLINEQIKLVEEKEQTLNKVKSKYKELLEKLETLQQNK